jgi:predicted aspartyl protease
MPHAIGSFDNNGNPILKIKVGGVLSAPTELTAIIDTGFTGFLSMPLIAAFPLGLPLVGTTSVVLADGQDQSKLMAQCRVTIDDKSEAQFGLVILEPSSTDILVGMEFLRKFKFGLFISSAGILLFDDNEFVEQWRKEVEQNASGAQSAPGA